MPNKIIEDMLIRCNRDKDDSDFTYFFAFLLTAEAMLKTIVLGMLAAIDDDTQQNRYRLLYNLVRANGIGDWSKALTDALSGTSSQFLTTKAQVERNELTKACNPGEWQFEAVSSMGKALACFDIKSEMAGKRTDMTRWFRMFATLRNKTRAHGAFTPTQASDAVEHLLTSISFVYDHFHLFQRPWVYLYRNLSGKYRVTVVGNKTEDFDHLKKQTTFSYQNGIYIFFDAPRQVPLLVSDPELNDFFLPNGSFSDKNYELLSYFTDDKKSGSSTPFLAPLNLQNSETHGHGELMPKGNCFSNAPESSRDYVQRHELESELHSLLIDRRHPVITLQGAGGIGKTSSTLQVIQQLYNQDRFEMVVWFSSRDIDLLQSGPKTVRPSVLSPEDIAKQYISLVRPKHEMRKKWDRKSYFQNQLAESDGGATLFVFDNFETVQNPVEMFSWIESHINLPNKVLITTRLRYFKGDYPLEVYGMTDEEARTLIGRTAKSLKILDMLDKSDINNLIVRSGGHPYVMKILLGEIAVTKNTKNALDVRRFVARRDELLTALFERTFEALSPCGKRAFLTLAARHFAVPRIALEAVLLRSTDALTEVEKGIELLSQYSLAEIRITAEEKQEFIGLPLAASEFGKKKLRVDVLKPSIDADVEILRMFAPSSISDINLSLDKVLERFIKKLSGQIDQGANFADYEPILRMICRNYNPGFLLLARWQLERDSPSDVDAAISNIQSFLEYDLSGQNASDAWQLLARAFYRKGDILGEVHAYIQRAQLPSVPFHDVSNTANLFNRNFSELDLEPDVKRRMSQDVLDVMEFRVAEARSADDFSRMAWLALHLDQKEKAHHFIDDGLDIDAQNVHCLNLAHKLGDSLA